MYEVLVWPNLHSSQNRTLVIFVTILGTDAKPFILTRCMATVSTAIANTNSVGIVLTQRLKNILFF